MEHNLSRAENGDYVKADENTEGKALASPTTNKASAGTLKTRCLYGVFMLFGFVFALLTKNEYIQYINKWMIEHDSGCTNSECVANQGAYRISFALFLFYFVHWILSSRCNLCMSSQQKINFNNGSFFWKVIAFIPLLIISFIIPNPFFIGYAWIAVFASILFLLAQLVILLDFSYGWSEKWAAQEEKRFQVGLVVCAILLYIIGLVVTGLLYHWYGSDTSCQVGIGFVTSTLLLAVICTFASIVAPRGSIIPAGVVFVYTTWTCYSALASGIPPGICNKLAPTDVSQVLIGSVFTILAMVYTCISAGNSRQSFKLSNEQSDEGEAKRTAEDEEASNFTFFHGIMMLGACYLAMLVTSWSVTTNNATAPSGVDQGETPMWVKFASEIACVLLYLWSLIAPSCCGNREFE